MCSPLPRPLPPAPSTRRQWLARWLGFAGALAAALAGLLLASAQAADRPVGFRVIAHAETAEQAVTREFLSDAFLKKASRWGGGELIRPVDLLPDAPARRLFSEAVHRRSVSAIRSYWQQRIFAGLGLPPPEFESDAAVVRYVQGHRGGVGYVSEGADISQVKVLTVR